MERAGKPSLRIADDDRWPQNGWRIEKLGFSNQLLTLNLASFVFIGRRLPNVEFVFPKPATALAKYIGRGNVTKLSHGKLTTEPQQVARSFHVAAIGFALVSSLKDKLAAQ